MRSSPERGALVDYRGRHPGPFAHTFCGANTLAGAACARCGRPLVALLSIDAADPLAGLGGLGLARLPLLFCWACPPARTPSFYALQGEAVAVLHRPRSRRTLRLPYRGRARAFPLAPARLVALPDEVEAHHRRLNRALTRLAREAVADDARVPCHQVGGEPLRLAPASSVTCPRCRRRMPHYAAIADDCLDPRGFTGNRFSQVLFHLCRACRVVGAHRQSVER